VTGNELVRAAQYGAAKIAVYLKQVKGDTLSAADVELLESLVALGKRAEELGTKPAGRPLVEVLGDKH
jgi:hypothetical protein